jgi:DNA-binding GntR family transcriptional regulator
MTFGAIEQFDTKSRLAHDAIKTSIIEGRYMPGQKIGISQIAKQLNMSDIPVREAMHRLGSEGLLEYTPHLGFRVTLPEFENYIDVYEVRQLLEGEAAEWAAKKISSHSLNEMRQLNEEMAVVAKGGDMTIFSVLNYRFHALLFSSCGNPVLVRQIEQVGAIYPRTRAIFAMFPERTVSALHEHEEILQYLEKNDSKGAKRAYQEHMARGYALLLKYKKALDETA